MEESTNNVFIHPTALVDDGAQLGVGTKVWHFSHIMPKAVLGTNCNIGQNVFIADGVTLGNGVKVQNNVSLYTGLTVEDEVFIGPSAVFTNVKNPRAAIVRSSEYAPTRICKGASIGANSTVVCGITLGEYCFIGAGAVVTRDVAPYALVVGTPAKQIGYFSRAGHRLEFDATGFAKCPETEEEYLYIDGIITYLGT